MKRELQFFYQFMRHPLSTGGVIPSSSSLGESLCSGIPESTFVVELGPGTGKITEKIFSEIGEQGRYLGFEINQKFITILKQEFSDIEVIHARAASMGVLLKERGDCGKVDMIISGLPLSNMDEKLLSEILESCKSALIGEGELRFFLYLTSLWLPKIRRFLSFASKDFNVIRKKVVWRNLPPAIIFVLTKR